MMQTMTLNEWEKRNPDTLEEVTCPKCDGSGAVVCKYCRGENSDSCVCHFGMIDCPKCETAGVVMSGRRAYNEQRLRDLFPERIVVSVSIFDLPIGGAKYHSAERQDA
jgi:hypothetical protein